MRSVRSRSLADSELTVNAIELTLGQKAGATLSVGNALDTRRPRSDLEVVLRERPVLTNAADSTRP